MAEYVLGIVAPVFDYLAGLVVRYPVPATLVTTLSVLTAVWTNHKNRAATIFGHSMQAVTHLDHRWESDELRSKRRKASAYLHRDLLSREASASTTPTASEDEALTSVLNFLETVGCFVKAGAIGQRLSWQLFGSGVQSFVESAIPQLEKYRNPHFSVFSELRYLYHIARVEEQRVDLPLVWVWTRASAIRLTWVSRRHHSCNWRLLWSIVYALAMGRVHLSCKLPPLFSKDELLEILAKHMRPDLRELGIVAPKRQRARPRNS